MLDTRGEKAGGGQGAEGVGSLERSEGGRRVPEGEGEEGEEEKGMVADEGGGEELGEETVTRGGSGIEMW